MSDNKNDKAQASPEATTSAGTQKTAPFWKPCALQIEGEFLGGSGLGLPTDVKTVLVAHKNSEGTSWLGFLLEIPLGAENEEQGFGVCHRGKLSPPCPLPEHL